MKPLLMSLVVLFGVYTSQAQINTFKILVKSGSSEIQIGEVITQLEKGMVLSGDFTLVMEEGSYLGLVHNSGNLLEVEKAGKYSAADLYEKVTAKASNTIVTRYTDFILNRQKEEIASGMMSNVTRSFEPFAANEVELYIPNAAELYGDKLALEWANESEYSVIQIMNIFEEVLFEERVEGKRHILNLGEDNLKNEEILMVKVLQENDIESQAVAIKRISVEEKRRHSENLESLSANISNSALLELIRAAYFEDNKLLADAFTSYVNAMLLEPKVEDYRNAYNEFLIRHELLKFIQKP